MSLLSQYKIELAAGPLARGRGLNGGGRVVVVAPPPEVVLHRVGRGGVTGGVDRGVVEHHARVAPHVVVGHVRGLSAIVITLRGIKSHLVF